MKIYKIIFAIGLLFSIGCIIIGLFTTEFYTSEEYLYPELFTEREWVEVTRGGLPPVYFCSFIGVVVMILSLLINNKIDCKLHRIGALCKKNKKSLTEE